MHACSTTPARPTKDLRYEEVGEGNKTIRP